MGYHDLITKQEQGKQKVNVSSKVGFVIMKMEWNAKPLVYSYLGRDL